VCAVSPRKVFTDRSRIQDYQRCPRLRYLSYHQNGMGLTSIRTPLPLSVGGSIHEGLAVLLREFIGDAPMPKLAEARMRLENAAVTTALNDFAQYALDPPDAERTQNVVPDFDDYLKVEQASLVEALVRSYSRRRLRPLLEQFEVLEVEREGQWQLGDYEVGRSQVGPINYSDRGELWFMSRPDALLRERQSGELYLLSYKTTGSWDARKARDAEHDMQGLSEGVEVERRLGTAWEKIKNAERAGMAGEDHPNVTTIDGVRATFFHEDDGPCGEGLHVNPATHKYLHGLSAPPRILGIRYEYLLKGERWRDKDLSQRFGFDARVQRSHLIRGYLNAGMAAGDEQWNHAWDYLKPDGSGETSKLNYRAWHSEPVWTHMPIAKWIDMLDDAAMLSVEGADRGYQSSAQATGTTATHPLDDVFIPPMIVYRNSDDLRDWVESTEYQEREVAEHVALVEAAADEGEKRSLLNKYFPMVRRACSYPTECVMVKICYGGEDIRRDPLSSGLYSIRVANHPIENEGRE
jgi:hypothetical protein